jgi:Alpha/beta hydrolase family
MLLSLMLTRMGSCRTGLAFKKAIQSRKGRSTIAYPRVPYVRDDFTELFQPFRDALRPIRSLEMNTITTKDGVEIFYKDLGKGQPIVFSHGWPLSADDWDTQMLFFLGKGFRVIAHDRRGHGRSTQTGDGHDMDHYADDLATLTAHLDLKDAVHVGHSTGGGEVPQRDGKVFACLPVAIRSRVVRKPIGALRRPPYF